MRPLLRTLNGIPRRLSKSCQRTVIQSSVRSSSVSFFQLVYLCFDIARTSKSCTSREPHPCGMKRLSWYHLITDEDFMQRTKKSAFRRIFSCVFLRTTNYVLRTVYAVILVTTPAPTVLPPSRIAKRIWSSIAIGPTSFTLKVTVSPGITISTPSASVTSPVTSVVRM